MRKIWVAMAALLPLAACGDNLSEEERATQDNADIAAVEASQKPPVIPIDPQAIRYPDIEKNQIYGASCAFAPEGGGLGAIVIAMADAGYMKLGGSLQRFAPDAGSAENPLGTRERYTGSSNSFTLQLLESEGEKSGIETMDFDAQLTVRDSSDRVVYQENGIAQCGV